jgi:hypothetical protein
MKTIKFVSYDGDFPNLCSGNLILEIDGIRKTFGYEYENDYPKFWMSGGCVTFDEDWSASVLSDDWIFDSYDDGDLGKIREDFTEDEYETIKRLFQENVPNGCCGGCV